MTHPQGLIESFIEKYGDIGEPYEEEDWHARLGFYGMGWKEGASEGEARWQKAIYDKVRELSGTDNIDGAGCDSGDPLDFTLSEISQGFVHVINERDDRIAELETIERAICEYGTEEGLSLVGYTTELHRLEALLKREDICPGCGKNEASRFCECEENSGAC